MVRDMRAARCTNRLRYTMIRPTSFSPAQLAEAAGVTPNYIGVVERGEKVPTLETVDAFSRALGVPIGALLAEDAPDVWIMEPRRNFREGRTIGGCA